ncbi:MAG: DUF1292 domain-containing protein [Selenomonadaceae bacterium]|nr:DUF1292 domain-containing protein [Selenomonadaceae bacterium]
MAKKNYEENIPEEDIIVEMTDDEGNVYYYSEEMIIPVGDENFALLVAIHDDEEEHFHDENCDCGCDDDEVIIAKIVLNENGEEEYVEPTDEEFERVSKAYDELMGEYE